MNDYETTPEAKAEDERTKREREAERDETEELRDEGLDRSASGALRPLGDRP